MNRITFDDNTLTIDDGKQVKSYGMEEFPCSSEFEGRAFVLRPADGSVHYNLLISDREPDWDSCDCAGHTYHEHCKHADAIRILIERKSLEELREYEPWTEADLDRREYDPAWMAELELRAEVYA